MRSPAGPVRLEMAGEGEPARKRAKLRAAEREMLDDLHPGGEILEDGRKRHHKRLAEARTRKLRMTGFCMDEETLRSVCQEASTDRRPVSADRRRKGGRSAAVGSIERTEFDSWMRLTCLSLIDKKAFHDLVDAHEGDGSPSEPFKSKLNDLIDHLIESAEAMRDDVPLCGALLRLDDESASLRIVPYETTQSTGDDWLMIIATKGCPDLRFVLASREITAFKSFHFVRRFAENAMIEAKHSKEEPLPITDDTQAKVDALMKRPFVDGLWKAYMRNARIVVKLDERLRAAMRKGSRVPGTVQ
jgi:hypothetical protein